MRDNISSNTNGQEQSKGIKKSQPSQSGIRKILIGVASTSRAAFAILKRTGQIETEKKKVYNALKVHQPTTSRNLSKITGLERSSICRSLFDLVNCDNATVKICFKDKCPVTNITVQFYSLMDYKQEGGADEGAK